MRFISIGRACNVKHQIDKHIGKSETLFFDWLITDIASVIKLLRCTSIEDILNIDSIKVDPDRPIVDSNSRILITSLPKCISIHDIPVNSSEKDIIEFIDKYKRRYQRIIDIINSNENVFFIRHGHVDNESKQLFIQTIQDINKNCNFTLVIVKANQSIDTINRNINILEINVTTKPHLIDDWTTDWMDWKLIFNTIHEGII
jgi:hypothetical protein